MAPVSGGEQGTPSLVLTMHQRNDCKTITFTDNSPWDNIIPIETIYMGSLTLAISIQTASGPIVEYEPIDLVEEFGIDSSATKSDLVFEINPSMLIVKGGTETLGTEEDVFPDGVYTISYLLEHIGIQEPVSFTRYILVDGVIANKVYALLRALPLKYECGCPQEKQILRVAYANSYLQAMHASTTLVHVGYVLNKLRTLEDIIANGTVYTW
jgi:hypothetical protein